MQSEPSTAVLDVSDSMGNQSRNVLEQSGYTGIQDASLEVDYWPHTVFLQTPSCHYSPHALHCTQILPGITLVVVSQMIRHSTADPLCQVLHIMRDMVQGRREKLSRARGLYVYEMISSLLMRIHSGNKKVKGRVQTLSSDIHSRWDSEELKKKLLKYLEQDTEQPMQPDLESLLSELLRRLQELFQQLFLVPMVGQEERTLETVRTVVSKMKLLMQKELMDYRDYLSVKAQRNITMTSYLDDFPGLIHFIFVDRQYHYMTAPSLTVIPTESHMDATLYFKEKMWKMYTCMIRKLQEGYTSTLINEGDFYYSYFIWFEDNMGHPLAVQEPYRPVWNPGALPGLFYKHLVRQCFPHSVDGAVHCYEMFMVHVGLVTPHYIAGHCHKLARKLWEMSGEAFTRINLL